MKTTYVIRWKKYPDIYIDRGIHDSKKNAIRSYRAMYKRLSVGDKKELELVEVTERKLRPRKCKEIEG